MSDPTDPKPLTLWGKLPTEARSIIVLLVAMLFGWLNDRCGTPVPVIPQQPAPPPTVVVVGTPGATLTPAGVVPAAK